MAKGPTATLFAVPAMAVGFGWDTDCRTGTDRFRPEGGNIRFSQRWTYQHDIGPIPDGREVAHICGNPSTLLSSGISEH